MGERSLTLHTKWPYVRVPSSERPGIVLTWLVGFEFGLTKFSREWPNHPYSTLHPSKSISSM
jgi:hypothetical protein